VNKKTQETGCMVIAGMLRIANSPQGDRREKEFPEIY
jgi:hypothetical protein